MLLYTFPFLCGGGGVGGWWYRYHAFACPVNQSVTILFAKESLLLRAKEAPLACATFWNPLAAPWPLTTNRPIQTLFTPLRCNDKPWLLSLSSRWSHDPDVFFSSSLTSGSWIEVRRWCFCIFDAVQILCMTFNHFLLGIIPMLLPRLLQS